MIRACPQLYCINLSSSSLCNVMSYLGKAISLSRLAVLQLTNCDLDDKALACLSKEISHSPFLTVIDLCVLSPAVTGNGLAMFILSFANETSNLALINLDPFLSQICNRYDPISAAIKDVNDTRKLYGHNKLWVSTATKLELENVQGSKYTASLGSELSRKKL